MENASKALLIAGGVLLAILILTVMVISYNNIVAYYNADKDMTKAEQVAKFNSEYTQFERDDVRGSDLLSLVNKVVDYNERNGAEYGPIGLKITIDNVTDFYYDKTFRNQESRIKTSYSGNSYHILSTAVSDIINSSGLNEKKLQLLAKNISNLFVDYSGDSRTVEYNERKRDDIIKEVLGQDLSTKTELEKNSIIKKAQKAASEYYQIMQFKRAHFRCITTETKYNNADSRISNMKFEFTGKFN